MTQLSGCPVFMYRGSKVGFCQDMQLNFIQPPSGTGDVTPSGKFCLNRPQTQAQDSAVSESPSLMSEVRRYQSLYSGLNFMPAIADPQQMTQLFCNSAKTGNMKKRVFWSILEATGDILSQWPSPNRQTTSAKPLRQQIKILVQKFLRPSHVMQRTLQYCHGTYFFFSFNILFLCWISQKQESKVDTLEH